MKAEVVNLRKNVNYLKYTDFTPLIKVADNLDVLRLHRFLPLPLEKDTVGIL